MIKETAYAKINLSLDVIGKRENGYHDVKMIMQTVDLFDELTFENGNNGIELVTDNEMLNSESDSGKDNLIVKAAKALETYSGKKFDVKIMLNKNIPIAAGMAGGSTDAAATLRGLNRLFDLKLVDKELEEIAVKIGADVPYCVRGGTKLSEGIGEILTELNSAAGINVLICKPQLFVSTPEVYKRFDSLENVFHPDVDAMLEMIAKNNFSGIHSILGNALEQVTVNLHPIIKQIEEDMKASGALNAIMSGSGPTVFGIFESKAKCQAAEKILKTKYADAFVGATRTI